MKEMNYSRGLPIPANSFRHLSSLTELDLSDNKMTNLDAEVFSHLAKLETLDLTGNPMNIPQSMFVNLKELKNVKLNKNQVSKNVEGFIRKFCNLTI